MPITNYTASTTPAAAYTSSGNTAITFLSICNYGVANVTANVYAVPSAGSANSATQIIANLTITEGDTYQLYAAGEKLLLATGDSIQIDVSANTSVTVTTSFSPI